MRSPFALHSLHRLSSGAERVAISGSRHAAREFHVGLHAGSKKETTGKIEWERTDHAQKTPGRHLNRGHRIDRVARGLCSLESRRYSGLANGRRHARTNCEGGAGPYRALQRRHAGIFRERNADRRGPHHLARLSRRRPDRDQRSKAGGEFVSVHLKPEAGKRLADKTAANVGKMLVTTWDGNEVMSTQIHAPFGENFEFTSPSEQLGRVMQVTLGHGRLPIAMRSFDYRIAQ